MNAREIALRCVTEEPGARDIEHWISKALTDSANEAYEAAAKVAEEARPPGGRLWDLHQSACYAALTDTAAAIRAKIERE